MKLLRKNLAQDVFIRVYRARHAYVPTAKFNTWLYRIVTNVVLNHFRDERHGNQNISLDAPTAAGVYFETPDRRHSVEQRLVREEVAREIWETIHGLRDKQRAAVLMHKYQNLDYSEIARTLRMSLPAIKAMRFRTYERLRSQLAHLTPMARIFWPCSGNPDECDLI